MRLVEKPHTRPRRCAVTPSIGYTHPKARWIDAAEMHGFDNRVYVSDIGCKELMRVFGFATPEQHAETVRERDLLRADLETARKALEELQTRFDAIDVLASADFVARKKPGRKPATEKAAA